MAPPGYLEELRRICSRRKALLIFDEAKTGIGKTGQMFACMCEEAVPDILICGKEMQASPGDLCIRQDGEQVTISPYKKKDDYFAVVIQVIRVVKQLN